MFPLLKDKVKQYDWDTEVIPGIRSIAAPGHTLGHTAFVVASGKEQLMVLSDTTNMPALFAKHPSWHGQIDADPVLAEATRRRLFDRAVSDKALVTGYHFPFPAVGTIVPDGAGYTFVPAAQLRTTYTETAIVRPHRWPFSTHYFVAREEFGSD